jgi:hypothetical protein
LRIHRCISFLLLELMVKEPRSSGYPPFLATEPTRFAWGMVSQNLSSWALGIGMIPEDGTSFQTFICQIERFPVSESLHWKSAHRTEWLLVYMCCSTYCICLVVALSVWETSRNAPTHLKRIHDGNNVILSTFHWSTCLDYVHSRDPGNITCNHFSWGHQETLNIFKNIDLQY